MGFNGCASQIEIIFETNLEIDEYLASISKKIKNNWVNPYHEDKAWQKGMVIVCMFVLPSGNLEKTSLMKSSGNIEIDNSAIDAIKKSSPFDELPNYSAYDFVVIAMVFYLEKYSIPPKTSLTKGKDCLNHFINIYKRTPV